MLALAIPIQQAAADYKPTVEECPLLTPRPEGPAGAHDLRPDDIKVIAAMGDSIMAGFALEGVDSEGSGFLNISGVTEYRGQSWAIGGDEGAPSLANFVNHYNSSLVGASIGSHIATICHAALCLDMFRNPESDVLNSALSGGIAMNLDDMLDYLIPRMKEMPEINYETDWKMITIQIGSNDQCAACLNPFSGEVTVEKYSNYVDAAIARIKKEIPRVLVVLGGSFKVSPVYDLTRGQEYCRPIFDHPDFLVNRGECSCFLTGGDDLKKMDDLADGYNAELEKIYQRYNAEGTDTFAIKWIPAGRIDVSQFPLEALSNFDCFHPGKLAHQWVAKIYCPTDDDRFRID
ncbi:hypothetical protein BJV82DRAFT_522349 [Fennellomyces sp. T-0311]|nr:hypothetical protein BJV82DRAFT_522349 [Fennellomyces sp. T-0311]